MNKIKRLFADIETLPAQVLAFSAGYNQTINHDAIFKERCIICIGYKWDGDKKANVLRFDKNQCDKAMLQEFIAIANEADEIVGHYGNHFDWPWIRTRALFHKLPPFPVWKTVDTKQIASKYFYFQSNKLDYISSFLGHGKKLRTEFKLWKDIALSNDQKSIDYMCKYCAIDVDRLEKVHNDMMAFVPAKTHAGVLAGGEKWSSPFGGGTNVKAKGIKVTANGTKQYQMQCLTTGRYYCISEASNTAYREWRKNQKEKKP
jgi:predicted PolB exonuclease-like 3'-5' exonuclease